MFFGTPSGASKIIDRMGLPVRSPEAKVLIRLIDWSAKQTDKMFQTMRKPAPPKAEGELSAAISMARNASATAEVARVLHIEPEKARTLLVQCREAAAAMASEAGLSEIADIATRDRNAGT
jgi:hypothetical protein